MDSLAAGSTQTVTAVARAPGWSSIIGTRSARMAAPIRRTCGCSAERITHSLPSTNTAVSTSSVSERRAGTHAQQEGACERGRRSAWPVSALRGYVVALRLRGARGAPVATPVEPAPLVAVRRASRAVGPSSAARYSLSSGVGVLPSKAQPSPPDSDVAGSLLLAARCGQRARPRIFSSHQRVPTSRKRQSFRNSGGFFS